MNRKTVGWIVVITVVVGIIAAIVLIRDRVSEPGEIITIGVILPMTGDLAFFGEGDQQALSLFAEGNPDVRFLYEDSKGTPRDGLTAAQYLLNQNVNYYITSLSYIVNTVQPVFDENKVLNITLSMDPRAEQQSRYCMRLYATMYQEMDALAELAHQQGVRRITVMFNDVESLRNAVDNYLRGLLATYDIELDIRPYTFGTRDFKDEIAIVAEMNPDLLRILDFGDKLLIILQQIEESGLLPDVMIVSGLETLLCDYTQISPDIARRYRFTAPTLLLDDQNQVVQAFELKYGTTPLFDAIFAYDIAQMLVPLIREHGYSNVDDVIQAIIQQGTFTGAAAHYTIDEHGGVSPEIEWARIVDGYIVFDNE